MSSAARIAAGLALLSMASCSAALGDAGGGEALSSHRSEGASGPAQRELEPLGDAVDIAAGATAGGLWKIGSDNRIYNYQDGVWVPDASNGHGVRIAVADDGHPWIVGMGAGGGAVWRYTTTDPSTGKWFRGTATCATDIGASSEVWIVGCSAGDEHPILRLVDGSFQEVTSGSAARISLDACRQVAPGGGSETPPAAFRGRFCSYVAAGSARR